MNKKFNRVSHLKHVRIKSILHKLNFTKNSLHYQLSITKIILLYVHFISLLKSDIE